MLPRVPNRHGWLSLAQIATVDKSRLYNDSLTQIKAITEGEPSLIANLANIAAILKQNLGHYWVGFYLVDEKSDELVLGPFQGTPACVRIARNRGVCGTCWEEGKSQVVRDVHEFPGHIACDANSKSEIVVPVFNAKNTVAMVLDIDHNVTGAFDETDRVALELLSKHITTLI